LTCTFPAVTVCGEVQDLGKAVLKEGGVISGTVLDGPSRRPLAGATVRVLGGMAKFKQSSGLLSEGDKSMQVTGDPGTFEFRGLKPGPVSLRVTAKGYATQSHALDSNIAVKSHDLRFELEPGGEISGSVVDAEGNLKKGIQVYLREVGDARNQPDSNERTVTDAGGRFLFEGLRAGAYRIIGQKPVVGAGSNVSLDATLKPGERRELKVAFDAP